MENISQIFAKKMLSHKQYRASNRSQRMAKLSLRMLMLNLLSSSRPLCVIRFILLYIAMFLCFLLFTYVRMSLVY